MSQEIINVLEYIGEKLNIALDWTSENIWPQVLDILGRYRILQIVTSSLWVVVALIALVVFICFWVKIFKAYRTCIKDKQNNLWWNWSNYYSHAECTGFVVAVAILSAVSLFLIIPTLIIEPGEILKWVFIPEIQFLELFKSITG